jgi:hypothetical protein
MPKKPGRGGGSRKNRRGQAGGGPPRKGGRGHGGKRGSGPGGRGPRPVKSDYFMQPGKRGVFVVLRRPIGNRAHAKECGTMPSRVHAKMLIDSLQRAESVVKDLFMEATDDGIEALEAILAATREDVLKRGPKVEPRTEAQNAAEDAESAKAMAESEESPPSDEDDEDPYADEEEKA